MLNVLYERLICLSIIVPCSNQTSIQQDDAVSRHEHTLLHNVGKRPENGGGGKQRSALTKSALTKSAPTRDKLENRRSRLQALTLHALLLNCVTRDLAQHSPKSSHHCFARCSDPVNLRRGEIRFALAETTDAG